MEYGLIGERLSHSFSKIIHEKTGLYSYDLHELSRGEVDSFMKAHDFKGINVTIPYKQTVIPYLDEISEQAKKIGAVNTIVNRGGKLYGSNTDYFGMKRLIEKVGLSLEGKKVLILGTGGTSRTANAVVTDLGCAQVRKASRTGNDGALTYEEVYEKYADAEVLINTTPCGMYPNIDDCPVDLDRLPSICGVIDVVYNPLRTVLVLEAQKRGIPAEGGLYMLVVQAICAAELFTDSVIDAGEIDRIYDEVLNSRRNIVLTGMSMAGKTTVGNFLSETLGKEVADTDQMIIKKEKRPITEIFATDGETGFRDLETEMICELSPKYGMVIATGGGAILRPRNVDALKKNGIIIFLDRPLEQILPTDDRPLANSADKVAALYKKRLPIYRSTCDKQVKNDVSPEDVTAKILSILHYNDGNVLR